MYTTLLRKFASPSLASSLITRPHIVARIQKSLLCDDRQPTPTRLILIHTPAGYGKTTLLVELAQKTPIQWYWYQLDQTDADLTTFLQRLLVSIRQQHPAFGQELDTFLTSTPLVACTGAVSSQVTQFVDTFIALLEQTITEPFALVLGNYHYIAQHPGICAFLNRLLYKLPGHGVLIIESRTLPELDVAPLLARREMVGFGTDLLRFSAQEIYELALLLGISSFTPQEAKYITTAFEGWVTGMLLGTRLSGMHTSCPIRNTQNSSLASLVDQQYLLSYMVTDIFQDHEDLYTFLKQVSILPILEPELCDALLNRTESAPDLATLEYQGLFVSRLADTPRISYQCHLFIRELLCNELQQTSPDLFRSLHLRAAEIWADKREYEQAVYHASQAQNDAVTASLIIDAAPFLQAQGRFETLLQWIDAIPVTVRERSSSLLVLHASLLLKLGLQEQAFPLLEAAEKAIQCDSDLEMQECVLLQSELRLLQSKWWFHAGDYQQSQKLCQHVLEKLSVDHSTLRAEAHLRLGVCANIVGNFGEGITHLQKALQYWGLRAKDQRVPEVHGALASAYSLMGNFVLAEHHLACALKLSDHFHDPWNQVYHLNRQGLLKHRQGLLTDAQACFEQALSLARDTLHFRRGEAYTLANLGELLQDQEQYAQALQMLEEGLSLARLVGDVYLINCTICIAAMTYLFIGDAVTAQMLLDEIRINDARSNGYEQALRMLALGTILLFQKRYEEALNTLTQLEPYFRSSGFKREMIQLTIRLASCQIQQGLQAQALERLHSLLPMLKQQQFEHLIHLELRRTPAVEHFFTLHVQVENTPQAVQIENEALLATLDVPLIYQPVASAKAIAFHIVAFGEPAVVLHGTPITRWRMARAMELFFFLLYQDQPTQKEQILTALWPDFDERVNQTFHSTIYYLRKAIGESCVCSHNNCYSLQLDSNDGDLFYDVARFKHYQHIAKKMLKEQAYEDAQSALSSLVDLYRGDYLQSFYSNWCILPRDELRQVYLWARERLAQITWQREQYDECIAHWQHMLAIDSCLEKAHLGLMRCYLQLGKRSSALQQYQRCCKILQEELGTLPDAKLQMLYNKYVSV